MSDVKGRLDVAILRLVDLGGMYLHSRTGYDMRDDLRRVAESAIKEWGIPTQPIDIPMTLARNVFGILPESPRKAAIERRKIEQRRIRKNERAKSKRSRIRYARRHGV